MGNPQLAGALLEVVMDDGAAFEVQTTNLDMLRTERHARERAWPALKDAPMEWATWMAWHAVRREGCIPADMSYDAFTERCISINSKGSATVDPTREAPEEG